MLTAMAEALAVVAFGLFFAKGVTDAGGDGIASFRITFYSMAHSFYFNAPLFIGFILPMFAVLFTFIPNKNSKVYLAPAVILLACGIMVACTYQCYLLPFTDEYAEMVTESGTHIAPEAAVASAFILLAAVLEAVKAFSPAPQYEQAAEAETAEEERAEQSADAPEEEVQADDAVEAAEEQTAGESAEDADRPQGE
mgnify:FL=1